MEKIVFFDGVCNLCNGFVNYCIDHDPGNNLFFASLQSQTAKKLLPPNLLEDFSLDPDGGSVVFWDRGKIYIRSHAVFQIVENLKGIVRLILLFRILPGWLLDPFYRFIARRRYKWFGKTSACRMPSPGLESRFHR